MFDQSEDGKLFSNRHSKNTDEEEHTHQVRPGLPGLPYIQVCFCPNADLLDEKFKINLSISNLFYFYYLSYFKKFYFLIAADLYIFVEIPVHL